MVRILGAGLYGCHIGLSLIRAGYDVEIHDIADDIFSGASGGIPARIHLGPTHYPRSLETINACQSHQKEFMAVYGEYTSCVPLNIYAIAKHDSLIDFGTYQNVLRGQIEFITINPKEFGLSNVEGAVLTGERHLLIRKLKGHFKTELKDHLVLGAPTKPEGLTIDCTFCANDSSQVDRYEPCLTAILKGPTDRAVTIMDGPFGSLYPWDEERGLNSLTSAKYTPFKRCSTWNEARDLLDGLTQNDIDLQSVKMYEQMRYYYPDIEGYHIVDQKLAIRALPRSGADSRLVAVDKKDNVITIRAGKIDAVIQAEREVKGILE